MNFKKKLKKIMISILEYLNNLLLEKNIPVFPKEGQFAKLSWWKGDHCIERQEERHISDSEITDALFGAYNDIKKLFAEGKLKTSFNGKDSYVVIVDARKDRGNPTCVCAFIRMNRHPKKLERPSFTVMTVFKKSEENQKDFAAIMRNGSKRQEENIIYLY